MQTQRPIIASFMNIQHMRYPRLAHWIANLGIVIGSLGLLVGVAFFFSLPPTDKMPFGRKAFFEWIDQKDFASHPRAQENSVSDRDVSKDRIKFYYDLFSAIGFLINIALIVASVSMKKNKYGSVLWFFALAILYSVLSNGIFRASFALFDQVARYELVSGMGSGSFSLNLIYLTRFFIWAPALLLLNALLGNPRKS